MCNLKGLIGVAPNFKPDHQGNPVQDYSELIPGRRLQKHNTALLQDILEVYGRARPPFTRPFICRVPTGHG